jgi:hypothetical protein
VPSWQARSGTSSSPCHPVMENWLRWNDQQNDRHGSLARTRRSERVQLDLLGDATRHPSRQQRRRASGGVILDQLGGDANRRTQRAVRGRAFCHLELGVGLQPEEESNPRPSDTSRDARRRTGRLRTDLACSRWMPSRSRRVPSDRLDDQQMIKQDRQRVEGPHGVLVSLSVTVPRRRPATLAGDPRGEEWRCRGRAGSR